MLRGRWLLRKFNWVILMGICSFSQYIDLSSQQQPSSTQFGSSVFQVRVGDLGVEGFKPEIQTLGLTAGA